MSILHSAALLSALLSTSCFAGNLRVLTNRYDNFGTGANPHERILTVSNVRSATFGKLFSYNVDGAVYAQPLYVGGVKVPGRGTFNVVYVATMHDRVYAFDAEHPGPPLWARDLTNSAAGVTPVPVSDITGDNDLNIVGSVGILGTPVIAASLQTLYLVARTKENGQYVQRLYAFDIRDGRDRASPTVVKAAVASTAADAVKGVLYFNPKTNNQRPALTFTKNHILIAWASHEDDGPYHGWVMAYDAKTLKQLAVFCSTPHGSEGGVWQSGRAAAVDPSGNIYYEIGNGSWNGTTDFGESLVKLHFQKGHFEVTDFYTPADYAALNERDADFGSSGPLLIPKSKVIVCGDKHGVLTLLNADSLGKLNPGGKQLLQSVSVQGGRILNGPALWDSSNGLRLFLWGEADVLKSLPLTKELRIAPALLAKGTVPSHGSPGGALTISSDGKRSPNAIVWALLTVDRSADHGNAAGALRAFNAETLAEVWNSEQDSPRDRLGTLVKFVPPTVAAGKVYAVTYDNRVIVYGLLSSFRFDSSLSSKTH